jgi:release factor glutamine methyltransferase
MNKPPDYSHSLISLAESFIAMPDKPEETPESILNALWLLAMGRHIPAEAAIHMELRELSNTETTNLNRYIDRWKSGEPLAHITNRQQFCELEFIVGQQALIPRKETEILAHAALDKIGIVDTPQPVVIDICTGCGNLPIVIKHHFPNAIVYASDLSPDAIELARRNADHHHLNDLIEFAVGDLLSPFENLGLHNNIDVVTCNPPYISSKKVTAMANEIARHEPSMAFDGGPFGVSILQRTINESVDYIKPNGWLIFEVGSGQGQPIVKMLERKKEFINIEAKLDELNQIRVIAVQRSTNNCNSN